MTDPASRSRRSCNQDGFPFDFAQGGESFDFAQERESFDFAQDREPVDRHVEPRVKPGMTNWPVLRIKDKIYNFKKAFDRRGTSKGESLLTYGEIEK
jgi:hypothetical protein